MLFVATADLDTLVSKLDAFSIKGAMGRNLDIIYYNMVTKKEALNIDLFVQNQSAFKEKCKKYLESQLAELKQVA